MEVPTTITNAIKIMSDCFGGIDVSLLKNNLVSSNGVIGYNISIDMYKKHNVFLPYYLAEDICFYGSCVANQIIYETCKDDILLMQRKIKLMNLSKNND